MTPSPYPTFGSFPKIHPWRHPSLRHICRIVDSIAASLFVWDWLSWQIVSDDKTQITVLILRRGAFSTPQRLPKCFFSYYRASVKIALMVNFNILATLVMTFSRCCLDEVCRVISFSVNWYHEMTPRRNHNTSTIRKHFAASLSVCVITTLMVRILKTKTKSTVDSGQIIFIVWVLFRRSSE